VDTILAAAALGSRWVYRTVTNEMAAISLEALAGSPDSNVRLCLVSLGYGTVAKRTSGLGLALAERVGLCSGSGTKRPVDALISH
jgi:hypothetical protein